MTSQRIIFAGFVGLKGGVRILGYMDNARSQVLRASALKYLRAHRVSADTQVQVLYGLEETRSVAEMANHYGELMDKSLPSELRQHICEELWSDKVLSMGLILNISALHDDFIPELVRLVRESVFASRSQLFAENDRCSASYNIIKGRVAVVSSSEEGIVDFTSGHWLGEKALVNPLLVRSATAITKMATTLLVIPAQDFHHLIARLGIGEGFERICQFKLPWGLCGRCGVIGMHFTDNCPTLSSSNEYSSTVSSSQVIRRLQMHARSRRRRLSGALFGRASVKDPDQDTLFIGFELELRSFMRSQGLDELVVFFRERDIRNLSDLAKANLHIAGIAGSVPQYSSRFSSRARFSKSGAGSLDLNSARSQCSQEILRILEEKRETLTPAFIQEYQLHSQQLANELMGGRGNRHLLFLSHCKLDAGTEACLMRSEIEQLITVDPGLPGSTYLVPCFLDSEDLQNLEQVQQRVRKSSFVALLLTTNVLTRPWCLVELWTAASAGVSILPVEVAKPGNEFKFPTEAFYEKMLRGDLLDASGKQVLSDCGTDLETVVQAVRTVFKQIAVTYSPHKSKAIRSAELRALLLRCNSGADRCSR